MKTIVLLAGFFTLTSCAQIEKATDKWKTPESAQGTTSATEKTETKTEQVAVAKKKTKKGTKQAKATTTTAPTAPKTK